MTKEVLLKKVVSTLENTIRWDREKVLDKISELGVKALNTHGLPFNGTTFELFRDVEINGNKYKEVIGHLKYFQEIYGKEVHVFIYSSKVEGGESLNGVDIDKYVYKKTFDPKAGLKTYTW